MLQLLIITTLFLVALGQSVADNDIAPGYPAEWHNVTTSDGYILGVLRIPHGKNSRKTNGEVAFLMHGLGHSYNSFTYLGAKYGMAYNLADAGYDVWLGNARGNDYSRRHVSLDPDSKEYFDFTLEEVGIYDVPAMVDYALAKTKRNKLHYISHSMGGTAFLILNSRKTEYQSKFIDAHLMAAEGYAKEFPNKPVKALSTTADPVYAVTSLLGFVELKSSSIFTKLLIEVLVNSTVPQPLIGGAAVRQAFHYMQIFRDEVFRSWNYGAITNLLKYGSTSPPKYDLSKIKVDVTLHYSVGDITSSEKDVLDMAKAMPNARARKIAKESFDHMDYLNSKDLKEYLTDDIIKSLKKA